MNRAIYETDHRDIGHLIDTRIKRLAAIAAISDRLSVAIRQRQFGSIERLLSERTTILETLVADAAAFEDAARAAAGSGDASVLERIDQAE